MLLLSSKVYNMYGLTEAGPRVTSQTDAPDNYEAGFAGKQIKNVSVKIINDSGEARINEEGRIIVKSNALMIGYYGDPELTSEKIQDGRLVKEAIFVIDVQEVLAAKTVFSWHTLSS